MGRHPVDRVEPDRLTSEWSRRATARRARLIRQRDDEVHERRTTRLSTTLEKVLALAVRGEVRVSLHGYEELAADQVRVRDIIDGVATAVVVEDYPDYAKGPCVLVLQHDGANQPIHVVWGIPAGQDTPAVVVTAYRPDPQRWDETWRRRRT